MQEMKKNLAEKIFLTESFFSQKNFFFLVKNQSNQILPAKKCKNRGQIYRKIGEEEKKNFFFENLFFFQKNGKKNIFKEFF